MMFLSRRALLGIAAVVDVAIHGRGAPVAAKALAARHGLPPRHLEPLLQAFVRAGILKGVRGPKGGYELARERRRITIAEIVKICLAAEDAESGGFGDSRLVRDVVAPVVLGASQELFRFLEATTVAELCNQAEGLQVFENPGNLVDFTI
jgi:Rrf2 family transcriptional regulator, iron-sulfur cluster assembly transcription factor